MVLFDYHVHSNLSPDSAAAPDELCARAVALGLTEIMATDHYEMIEGMTEAASYRKGHLDLCKDTVMECRDRWKNRVYLGFGIEIGQSHVQKAAAKRVLKDYSFDYVLASFHRVGHVDLSLYDYHRTDCAGLRREYVEGLLEIAEQGDYDCLAHLDLIKRYAAMQGVKLRLEECREAVNAILRCAVKRGKGLEINTSGLHGCLCETLPSYEILTWYRQMGGQIITVGSDAHRAADMAAGYPEAEEMLKALGFEYVARFRERKVSFVKM